MVNFRIDHEAEENIIFQKVAREMAEGSKSIQAKEARQRGTNCDKRALSGNKSLRGVAVQLCNSRLY